MLEVMWLVLFYIIMFRDYVGEKICRKQSLKRLECLTPEANTSFRATQPRTSREQRKGTSPQPPSPPHRHHWHQQLYVCDKRNKVLKGPNKKPCKNS